MKSGEVWRLLILSKLVRLLVMSRLTRRLMKAESWDLAVATDEV